MLFYWKNVGFGGLLLLVLLRGILLLSRVKSVALAEEVASWNRQVGGGVIGD